MKHPQSEELTKIRTVDDALDEFDRDDQTMIGNSEELAAKSMLVPDPHAPTVARASTNVIRRTGPTLSVRPPSDLAAIAEGTKDQPIDDDDAFAPWDDNAQQTAPQAPEQLRAALKQDGAITAPIVAPLPNAPTAPAMPVVAPLPPVVPPIAPQLLPLPAPAPTGPIVVVPPVMQLDRPMIVQPAPAPPEPVPVKGYRWDRIAFLMVIVALVGMCVAGYLRITALQDELARTKAALDAKSR